MQDEVSSRTSDIRVLPELVNKSLSIRTDTYLRNVWVLFEFFSTGSIVGHFSLHASADITYTGFSFPPRKNWTDLELHWWQYLHMHTHWLSNHNNLSPSTCLDCLSEGFIRSHNSLTEAWHNSDQLFKWGAAGLASCESHWNTPETCSHCLSANTLHHGR